MPDNAGGDWSSTDNNGLLSWLGDNAGKAAPLLGAGALGLSLLGHSQSPYPAEKSFQTLATNNATQGQSLAGYLNSGSLPPGAQQGLDLARNAAEAHIRSADARLGLSGSTMEAQQLGMARQQAAGQQFLEAHQLLQSGLQATGLAAGEYGALLQTEMARDQQFNGAVSNFAKSLSFGMAGRGFRPDQTQLTGEAVSG